MSRVPVLALFVTFLVSSSALAKQPASVVELPTSKPEKVGMSSEKLALVKPALQQFVDDGKVAGAIAIAARRGKVVLFEAVGLKDTDTKEPMQKDSILRFYSMTKPITSVAIMMLVEEGKIGLDDPISKHVPEFSGLEVFVNKTDDGFETEDLSRAPTVRDLLRHTAGLTYGFFGSTPIDRQYLLKGVLGREDDLQTMINKVSTIPLLFQPGTKFNYSVATDVLGHIVATVSGQRLDEFLRERVLDPLDMRDTGFHVPKEKQNRFASNHETANGGGQQVSDAAATSRYLNPPKLYSGGGGSVSTARDYMRFCQMMLNKGELSGQRLLKAETVEQMTKNQLSRNAFPMQMGGVPRKGVGFGLGFSVVVEDQSDAPDGVYGWGGAASTHFWISPSDDLAVVVLSQHMPFSPQLESAVKPLVYDAIVK
jgi:CubicO group peptidase (beta-lactamase class C family)